jgi:hypothetical protein
LLAVQTLTDPLAPHTDDSRAFQGSIIWNALYKLNFDHVFMQPGQRGMSLWGFLSLKVVPIRLLWLAVLFYWSIDFLSGEWQAPYRTDQVNID